MLRILKSDLLCSFDVSQVQELGLAVAYNNYLQNAK